jgi:hypothetical protein
MVVRISARISKRYIVARRCFEFTPFDKKWDGPPFILPRKRLRRSRRISSFYNL